MNKDYKNLQLAFEQFDWQPPKEVFRVYYDDAGTITCKTTQCLDGQHVTVTRELYDSIYMHTQWWVKNGKVELRPVAQNTRPMLKSSVTGPYRTLPETPVFLADESYQGPTLQWTF